MAAIAADIHAVRAGLSIFSTKNPLEIIIYPCMLFRRQGF